MRNLFFVAFIANVYCTGGLCELISLETSTTSTITEAYTTQDPGIHECGGIVEVGRGETVIEYAPPGAYQNYEFCVWTLVPTEPYSGWTIDYVSYGMGFCCDGVTVYNWDESGIVTTIPIAPSNSNATISLSKPYATIAFASDWSGHGVGFQVTITGTGNLEGDSSFKGFVLNQTTGAFSYPEDFGVENYNANERVAVVVQTPEAYLLRQLAVTYTDIQDDTLMVYELYPYHSSGGIANLVGMTNGSHPEGDPSLDTSSQYPWLVLFQSNNNSNTGKGFSISSFP